MNRANRPRMSRISGSSYDSRLMSRSGDGSTLSLDFTAMGGVLDPRLTFTRASTATYINSSGYVTTAAANVARFDYDPVTLAPRGLLIEGTAVNLAYRSNDFALTPSDGNNWNSSGYTADFTSTLLPDGSTGNARRLSMASGAGSYRSSSITVTASTTYTFSFWARNNGGSQARYRVWNLSAGSSIVDYNLSGSNYVASIGGANNTSSTWVRISITFTTPAGCTSIFVYPCSSDSGTVDLLIWGAQLELGSGASSYISTGANQVTRNADKMSMDDISTMQWNQTAGTFSLHMNVSAETNTSSFPTFMGMYTATPVRVVRFLLNNSSGTTPRIGNDTWTATPSQIVSNIGNTRPFAPNAFKYAVSLSNTGQTLNQVVNAGTVVTTSGTGTMQTPTRLLWNQDPSALDTEYFPIHMRSLKYWPTALPNAQLQSITT